MEETSQQAASPTDAASASPNPAQSYSSTFETGRPYQVHHSYIWLSPLAATFAFAAAIVMGNLHNLGQSYEFLKSLGYGGVGFLVAVVVLVLLATYGVLTVIHVLAYRNLSFVFDEKEFSLYSGIITKKHVHVPYARVQSVNHRATLVQRLFGVCTVTIDTAGGSANKAVRVPYVQLGVGERIRTDLFVRKAAAIAGEHARVAYLDEADRLVAEGLQGVRRSAQDARTRGPVSPGQLAADRSQVPIPSNVLDSAAADVSAWRGAFAGNIVGMEPVSYEFGLTNRELALTSMSHGSAVVLSATFGAMGLIGAMTGFMGVMLLVVFAVVGWIAGIVRIALSFGGFRACRRGDRIEVERGLLQHEFSGIDIDRVQSVVVRQSFVRRCMGYCEVSLGRVDTATDEQSKNSGAKLNRHGLVVHPFVKADRVDELLANLIPEFSEMPVRTDLRPLPDISLRRAIMRRCIWRNAALWTAAAFAIVQVVSSAMRTRSSAVNLDPDGAAFLQVLDGSFVAIYIVCALITIALGISAVLWKKHSGFAFNHGYTAVRNDGLHTEFVVVPRRKIQSGYTRSNPFQRHGRVASVVVTTAAGVGSTSTLLWDVRREQGEAWLDWLVPRGSIEVD
jgi:putative membrane protein